jgi:hypothetical protein
MGRKRTPINFIYSHSLVALDRVMYQISYLIVLILIILSSPFLPTSLLLWLDTLVIRMAMVVLLLGMMMMGPTVGIIGLMTIAILYLERNRRKVEVALQQLDRLDSNPPNAYATVSEGSTPQQTVQVRSFDMPSYEQSDYLPLHEEDSVFEPVSPSINQKEVLASVYRGGDASPSQLYEELGFGHVPL